MNPSILTLREIKFLRANVDVNLESKIPVDEYSFEGADLGWNILHGRTQKEANTWWVAVWFSNTRDESKRVCPYKIDVRAMGIIAINEAFDEAKKEEIVYENGAALVYGAIRELVSTMTGRFIAGSLVLPTPTFIGEFKARQAVQEAMKNSPGNVK